MDDQSGDLVYRARGAGPVVRLHQGAVATMLDACAGAGGKETGGILVGRYALNGDAAVVDEVLLAPRDSAASAASFQRGTLGLEDALRARWEEDPRRYYLGEWHYHARGDGSASFQDLRQIKAIGGDSAYACPRPVLIVASGGSAGRWTLTVFVLGDGGRVWSLR